MENQSLNKIFQEYHENLGDITVQSNSKTINPSKKWANIVLPGENETVLEGTKWKSVQAEEIVGCIDIHEFCAGGKLVRTSYYKKKYGDFRDEVMTYICTWSREGDIVKMIYADGGSLFEGKYRSDLKKLKV